MNLTEQLLEQIADPTLTRSARAKLRCRLAKALSETGNYEGARQAMGELWSRVGEPPVLDELDRIASAEVLLRVGVLTSFIGSANQLEGAQEAAKDLISESITIFESLEDVKKVAEGRAYLGHCYWRQGEYREARIALYDARLKLSDEDIQLKAFVLLLSAIVEKVTARLNDALLIHLEAAPLFEKIDDHALKGKFHNELAIVFELLSVAEHRKDYIDRALMEYTAASFHLEQAGHVRFCGCVENNLALLFSKVGRFKEAHEHVDRARGIFAGLKDRGSVAQVDETRARIFLEEGKSEEAERVAGAAVRALGRGDERALLAEASRTWGVALARLGRFEEAREVLVGAAAVAEEVGDREGAGQARLALVEELGGRLEWEELGAAYVRASELLEGAQHRGVKERLVACARRVIGERVNREEGEERFETQKGWDGFSFRAEVKRYERFLIERALKEAGGVVTRAAQLLGFKHHYSLVVLLNKRHKELLHARSPVVRRKRSVLRPAVPPPVEKPERVMTILHAEDNKVVADALRDALQSEGWRVETYADGATAQQKLRSAAPYDLLLLDNDLPGVSGLQLARLARRLPHRRRTPIIMLSASDCEPEAWRAGVDAYLRKPDDVLKVAEVAARLLGGRH